jgi:Ca2+-binding RTX toxin-like protein
LIAALLLFAGVPTVEKAEASAQTPSCAEGPVTVGGTTYGTPCDDLIVASPKVAVVRGGRGNDTIVAPLADLESCPAGCRLGVGSQTFEGGPGNDIVFGERGNDILRGGAGDDRLYGGIGDDKLEGGPGDDLLSGGFGADAIDGGPDSDYVRGDGTQDEIVDTGTGGADTLSYSTGIAPGFTRDVPSSNPGFPAKGGERGVYLDLSANLGDDGVAPNGGGVDKVEGTDFERIVGSPFSDYIVGSKPGQSIYGGGGADVLVAKSEGDHLFGDADGDDCSGDATTTMTSCESEVAGGPVVPRNSAKVSVGLMTSGETSESQLYFLGSSGHDEVTATYSGGLPATVTFGLSGSSFDTSPSASAGCEIEGGEATCPVEGSLDSVLLAGLGGDDALDGSGLPATASLIVLGGAGNDTLTGGEESDDTLVDGAGNDALHGLGGDDALLNNEGADRLFGEGGNDLFLSNEICEGDLVDGGEGRDNASWAKFEEGVEARLDQKVAGRPGPGGAAQCSSGFLDTLEHVEDLEGTSSADVFYGDAGPNQLLGHLGADTYAAEGGDDTVFANSGDPGDAVGCGAGTDVALIDLAEIAVDTASPDCETVQEAAPNSFRIETELPPSLQVPAVEPTTPPKRDTTPPRTRIVARPRKVSTIAGKGRRRVVFRFAASERGSSFRCKLDGGPFKACASPRVYLVGPGKHTVRIVAVDPTGNSDPSPALFGFDVRRR